MTTINTSVPLVHLGPNLTQTGFPEITSISQRTFTVPLNSPLTQATSKLDDLSVTPNVASSLWKNLGKQTIGSPLPPIDQRKDDVYIEPYTGTVFELKENTQVVDWGVEYLKALDVHNKTRGEKACVFILDTSGKFDHPDLVKNALHEYAKNFSSSPTMDDKHGHGTHCAGIACASDNTFGVVGVAPGAKLVPVKVLNDSGSGTYEGIAKAIRHVADLEDFPYKKVISMSLGGASGSDILRDAIQYAIKKGVFIVAAAGNSGYNGRDTVNYPGAYPEVITIASIGPNEKPSRFSSGGPAVDLTAPGEKVFSTHKNGQYIRMSGTSMATPHVAGIAALVLSAHEFIQTQDQLADFLMKGAKDLHTDGKDVRTGAGAPIAIHYFKDDGSSKKTPDAA